MTRFGRLTLATTVAIVLGLTLTVGWRWLHNRAPYGPEALDVTGALSFVSYESAKSILGDEVNAPLAGPYDQLDRILRMYFELKATPSEIVETGFEPEFVRDILNRVESPANEFKRRQLPPTLIISRNAIGIGRRRPVTHRYHR